MSLVKLNPRRYRVVNYTHLEKMDFYAWLTDRCPKWNFSWGVIVLPNDTPEEFELEMMLRWQ